MSVYDGVDYEVDQGADVPNTTLPWIVGGIVQSLVGYSAAMMIRQRPTDNQPLLTLGSAPTIGGSVVTPNGVSGTVTVTLGNADTMLLPYACGPLEYELVVTSGSGAKTSFQRGRLLVNASILH
jgi:hypothetical protein